MLPTEHPLANIKLYSTEFTFLVQDVVFLIGRVCFMLTKERNVHCKECYSLPHNSTSELLSQHLNILIIFVVATATRVWLPAGYGQIYHVLD